MEHIYLESLQQAFSLALELVRQVDNATSPES
jgi:hypothetical protein